MRTGWNAKQSFNRSLWMTYVISILFLLMYIIIYWFQPFSEFWNNFFSNFFLQIASLAAAVIAFKIWKLYDRNDPPRLVWGLITLSLAIWSLAELSWGYINMTQGEVPVGLPDVFWVISYPLLGLALLSQYQILARPTVRGLAGRVTMVVLLVAAFTVLTYTAITSITGSSSFWDALVNSFYPVGDIFLAVTALRIARNFAGGAFSRPWLGLIVFAFADLIYAWLEISGMYSWSVDQGNLVSAIADVAYLAAYLVMVVNLLHQWLFLKYGMRSS